MAAAQTDLLDIAAGAVVLSFSSEYSPAWAALLLIDGSTKTGWCNGKPNPNTIVIELPRITELSTIVLDNTDTPESSYPGISARHVEIHASTTSSTDGFQKIATLEAAQGKRKEFPLAPTKARWLRLIILSNWGHAQYTELMELEANGKPLEEVKAAAISGVYVTNYGPLLLKQFGSNVYGCYGGGNTVWGSFNGRVLQAEWRHSGSRIGTAMMVLSSDNEFLNGLWYEHGSYQGLWFGNRDSKAKAGCTLSESDAVGRSLKESGRAVLYGIQFDSDSAKIRPESEQTLRLVVDVLKKDSSLQVLIEGHTDSSNTDEYNQRLSQKRAEAVVGWLVQNGIAANRVSAQGLGESRPASDNDTPQGRALNRRVEIVRR